MTNEMMATTSQLPGTTAIRDGAVIEVEREGEAMTALVLLAGDDLLILDPCDGTTPFVVRYDELGSFRVFEPGLLGLAA
jgi:hypothetical protein